MIADKAGLSVATIDRVINCRRPGLNPKSIFASLRIEGQNTGIESEARGGDKRMGTPAFKQIATTVNFR
jgi:hypothetical protein